LSLYSIRTRDDISSSQSIQGEQAAERPFGQRYPACIDLRSKTTNSVARVATRAAQILKLAGKPAANEGNDDEPRAGIDHFLGLYLTVVLFHYREY